MDDVASVDTKESQLTRVQSVEDLRDLLPFVSHNLKLVEYLRKQFREPSTLVLRRGRSCLVASVVEHDFFGRLCLIAWGQNPEHYSVREHLDILEEWARSKGCDAICAFVGEEGPWDRIKAFSRLTGLKPYRMVFARELV